MATSFDNYMNLGKQKDPPMQTLVFSEFIRKPFVIEATLITEENLSEVAALVGEVKEKADGEKYIAINRRIVPNVPRAFVGWYVTRMDDNLRCYNPKIFNETFVEKPSLEPVSFVTIEGKTNLDLATKVNGD